jgi:sensor histidine kinase YesM
MKLLRRIFSSFRGLLAGLVALGVYLILPELIRVYDPSAGTFDAGYLQWIGLATFLTFWSGFVGWVLWQLIFSSLDKDSSNTEDEWGNLRSWFTSLPPQVRWYVVQITFLICVAIFLICLKLVPLS